MLEKLKKDYLVEVVLRSGQHVAGRVIEETEKAICLDMSRPYKASVKWVNKAQIRRVKGNW